MRRERLCPGLCSDYNLYNRECGGALGGHKTSKDANELEVICSDRRWLRYHGRIQPCRRFGFGLQQLRTHSTMYEETLSHAIVKTACGGIVRHRIPKCVCTGTVRHTTSTINIFVVGGSNVVVHGMPRRSIQPLAPTSLLKSQTRRVTLSGVVSQLWSNSGVVVSLSQDEPSDRADAIPSCRSAWVRLPSFADTHCGTRAVANVLYASA